MTGLELELKLEFGTIFKSKTQNLMLFFHRCVRNTWAPCTPRSRPYCAELVVVIEEEKVVMIVVCMDPWRVDGDGDGYRRSGGRW